MAWLTGALEIIKAIPTVVTVIKYVWDAYLEMKDTLERRKKDEEMKKALADGDHKKVEELLGKK